MAIGPPKGGSNKLGVLIDTVTDDVMFSDIVIMISGTVLMTILFALKLVRVERRMTDITFESSVGNGERLGPGIAWGDVLGTTWGIRFKPANTFVLA